jgi:hypothetical protein
MKAFIERCRSRGKDGSHTKTVCDMHGSVLACEVALTSSNTTAALEENPASGTTRSGTIQCRHEGCLKIFQTNSNRNKHERSHSLRIADDNLSPKRQRIETKLFSPTESIRDKRLDAHRALGWRAIRDVRDQNITQVSNSSIRKLKFALLLRSEDKEGSSFCTSHSTLLGDAAICCKRGNADGRRIAFLPKLCLRRWEDTYISKKVDD